MIEQIQIEFTNNLINNKKVLNQDNIEKIEKLVKEVLGKAFNKEALPYNFFILIVFVSAKEIKEKNKEYRNIDEVTDVLSFPVFEKNEIENIIKYIKGNKEKKDNKNEEKSIKKQKELPINLKTYLNNIWSIGEIYINLEKIKEQAIEYNHSFNRELAYILIHGFYHLLGYNHIKNSDKKIMREKEETILELLNIKRGNV